MLQCSLCNFKAFKLFTIFVLVQCYMEGTDAVVLLIHAEKLFCNCCLTCRSLAVTERMNLHVVVKLVVEVMKVKIKMVCENYLNLYNRSCPLAICRL